MKEWLNWTLNLPCVLSGEVHVDTRGPWPVLICGQVAKQVESKDDVINFVIQYVD